METKDEKQTELVMKKNDQSKKKHFVLVHGACHGAWCWYKLIPLLKSYGHQVTALDLAASGINMKQAKEIRTISEYIEPLMKFMDDEVIKEEEKVILVGHSLGGLAISKVIDKFPHKVSAAVFLTAITPGPALNIPQLFQQRGDSIFTFDDGPDNPSTTFTFGPNYTSSNLYQLSPPEDVSLAITLIRPVSTFSGEEEMSKENIVSEHEKRYGSINVVYVMSERDKALIKEFQLMMIKNYPYFDEVREIIGSDHMVMISKPHELSACLQDIAQAC